MAEPVTITSSGAWRVTPLRPLGRTYATTCTAVRAASGAVLAHEESTAPKQAEEAHAQLAALVEASEDAITGKTLDGTITSWNPAATRLYGYSAEEAIGRSVSLLYPPDRRYELPELLARVARGESITQFETERLRKDGTRIAVSVSLAPVRAASGAVVGAAVVARDITERKRAEEALRASEARLGAFLNAAPDAGVIVDTEGRIVRVNAQTERLFGYAREELLGQPVELLLPERFRWSHVQHRGDYLAAPRARPMDTYLDLYAQRKDGSEFPVEISLSPLQTAEGTLVISAIRDVTLRKQAEQALAQSNQEMERADAELACAPHILLVDDNPDDRALIIHALRQAFPTARVTEVWEAAEFERALTAAACDVVVTDYLLLWSDGLTVLRRVKERRADCPVILFTDSGSEEVAVEAMKAGADDYVIKPRRAWRLATAVRLALERVELRARERAARAEAERQQAEAIRLAATLRASAAQRRFVDDAAHELRTPLTTMRGNLDLLQHEPPLADSERRDVLTDLIDETERVSRLVDDLLTLASADAGRPLPQQRVPLAPLLDVLCRQAAVLAPDRTLVCHSAPDLAVLGDPDALQQVLLILLDNALKFSPPGSTVTVTAAVQGPEVALGVQDRGPGIAPEMLPRLFERFARGDEARATRGSGLGLAIAKALVEGQQGTLTVESRLGAGSRFTVTLPRAT